MEGKRATLTITCIVLAALVSCQSEGAANTAVPDGGCNKETYTTTDPYAANVDYVLQDLLTTTASSGGMDRRTQSLNTDGNKAFGHGSCSTRLSAPDCVSCIQSAYLAVLQYCAGRVGARVIMNDCSIRYENYYFTDK